MYSEVIKKNMQLSAVKWWPRFAYHYTDISNAVSILLSGKLYSRISASHMDLMKNDNASRQVIDMTSSEITSYVRFYFRPLTPTQYYNEGFKHYSIRYDKDVNANVPVPVFFVFDLNKLLCDPKTMFSECSQAGYGTKLYKNVADFERLNFEKIYGYGIPNKEDVPYRHAEIVYPEQYEIEESLAGIVCRNETEKQSLSNLIREQDKRAFYKYKNLITVRKNDMFENNGFFVSDCDYHGNTLGIRFSNSKSKRDYLYHAVKQDASIDISSLKVSLKVTFKWVKRTDTIYYREFVREIDYSDAKALAFTNIPDISGAKELQVRIFIEGKLMSFLRYKLGIGEVI